MSIVYAVKNIMSKPLITIDVESFAGDAIKLMIEKDIGALVVTEKGEPTGIVTERDILRKCCQNNSCMKIKIGEIMSKPLITIDGEKPIGMATEIMATKNIRRLLVTEGEKIVGIITQRDLVRGTLDVMYTIANITHVKER